MLEENPNLAKAENRPGASPSLRERVKVAVGHAVRLGVDEEQAEFAREYLAHWPCCGRSLACELSKGASVGGLFCFKIDFILTGFLFVDVKGSTFV
jgi:hypothetical protein